VALPVSTAGQKSLPAAAPAQVVEQAVEAGQNPVQTVSRDRNTVPVEGPRPAMNQAAVLSQTPAAPGIGDVASVQAAASAVSAVAAQSSQPGLAPLNAGKAIAAGGEKSATPVKSRAASGAASTASAQPAVLSAQGQLSTTAADVSATAREGVSAHAAVVAAGSPAGASTATGPDSREAFATLDAAGTAKPAWIHAGTQRAEAGYQDPALGWVSVRADASGGGVHAELVPATADAAQALGGHLAGLNAFLAERHSSVDTVTVTAPEGGWATSTGSSGSGGDQGAGGAMQQGAGQQQAGQQAADQQTTPDFAAQTGSTTSRAAAGSTVEAAAIPAEVDRGATLADSQGRHISVMA
jgi:hypothetical protein